MVYIGSKRRIAPELILAMGVNERPDDVWFVEPFSGGCNMTVKVVGKRIANDLNRYIVALFRAVMGGWIPEPVSQRGYTNVRLNPDMYEDHIVGFVGTCASFRGKWFGGFCGMKYQDSHIRNLMDMLPYLEDVVFNDGDYMDLHVPENSILYLDPPYGETLGYGSDGFDSERMWDWARMQAMMGCTVYVSEYNAPEDFVCVWEKEVHSPMNNTVGDITRVERLFMYHHGRHIE